MGAYQEITDPSVKEQRKSLQQNFEDMAAIFAPNAKMEIKAEETDRPRGLSLKDK